MSTRVREVARIGRQNRVVIPRPILKALAAKPGDLLVFETRGGKVYVSVADIVRRV